MVISAKQARTAAPVSIGTANSAGAGENFALANHVHAHDAQTDGTLHAAATTSVAGFLSAADKTKLNAVAASADVSGVKLWCKAATTGTVTMAGGAPNSADGVSLAVGDRVLAGSQSPSSGNGIYEVVTLGTGSNGTWQRTADADVEAELPSGVSVYVTGGTTNQGFWQLSYSGALTLGTTAISVTRRFGPGTSTPAAVGTAAIGVSSLWARSDHVHGHGAQASDGTMHAAATTSVAGFMAAADKINVNRVTVPNAPAYGATITLDVAAAASHHIGVLTGDVVLSFSNAAAGLTGEIYVKQDSTGGRSVAFVAPSPYVLIVDSDVSLVPLTTGYATTVYTYSFMTIGSFSFLRISKKQLNFLHAYRGILGSNLAAFWHQSSPITYSTGVNVQYWYDIVGNRYLIASGGGTTLPVYGTDGSYFQGKPIVQIAVGGKVMANASLTGLIPASSRPYIFSITRYRTTTGSYPYVFLFGSDDVVLYANSVPTAPKAQIKASSGTVQVSNTPGDTNVHRDEIWLDGTNAHFTRDGVDSTVASTGTLPLIERIDMANGVGDIGIFCLGVCAAVPSAAQRAALQALMAADAA